MRPIAAIRVQCLSFKVGKHPVPKGLTTLCPGKSRPSVRTALRPPHRRPPLRKSQITIRTRTRNPRRPNMSVRRVGRRLRGILSWRMEPRLRFRTSPRGALFAPSRTRVLPIRHPSTCRKPKPVTWLLRWPKAAAWSIPSAPCVTTLPGAFASASFSATSLRIRPCSSRGFFDDADDP